MNRPSMLSMKKLAYLKKAGKMIKIDVKFLACFTIVLLWTIVTYYMGTIALKIATLVFVCAFSLLSVRKYFKVAFNILWKKIGRGSL